MGLTVEIVELLASMIIFLGSIIALVSALGIVKFQDVFLRSHAATKSSTLALMLTLMGVFIYLIVDEGYVSVRMILALVFINLTSPVGGHLITRAAYRTGAYMYRKDDTPTQTDILLKEKRYNTLPEREKRAKSRERRRKEF